MLALAAAGPVLELVEVVHPVASFFPFSLGKFLLLFLLLLFARHAAMAWLAAVSALTPMAQIKPRSLIAQLSHPDYIPCRPRPDPAPGAGQYAAETYSTDAARN